MTSFPWAFVVSQINKGRITISSLFTSTRVTHFLYIHCSVPAQLFLLFQPLSAKICLRRRGLFRYLVGDKCSDKGITTVETLFWALWSLKSVMLFNSFATEFRDSQCEPSIKKKLNILNQKIIAAHKDTVAFPSAN